MADSQPDVDQFLALHGVSAKGPDADAFLAQHPPERSLPGPGGIDRPVSEEEYQAAQKQMQTPLNQFLGKGADLLGAGLMTYGGGELLGAAAPAAMKLAMTPWGGAVIGGGQALLRGEPPQRVLAEAAAGYGGARVLPAAFGMLAKRFAPVAAEAASTMAPKVSQMAQEALPAAEQATAPAMAQKAAQEVASTVPAGPPPPLPQVLKMGRDTLNLPLPPNATAEDVAAAFRAAAKPGLATVTPPPSAPPMAAPSAPPPSIAAPQTPPLETISRLKWAYESSGANKQQVLNVAKELFPDNWQEIMKMIKAPLFSTKISGGRY